MKSIGMDETSVSDPDRIFDIFYSVPTLAHSAGLAEGTPSSASSQESMYIPDYGGVLELPELPLKCYAIRKQLPFEKTPIFAKITSGDESVTTDRVFRLGDCKLDFSDGLVVEPYLNHKNNACFSVIKALGSNLSMDFITKSDNQAQGGYLTKRYAQETYNDSITGLKFIQSSFIGLSVKSRKGIRILKLNPSYKIVTDDEGLNSSHPQKTHEELSSTLFETTSIVKDVSINPHNPNIQSIGSDDRTSRILRIYDLERDTTTPYCTSQWQLDEEDPLGLASQRNRPGNPLKQAKQKRIFKPSKEINYGMQQVENLPSHLVNILVTTDRRTFLFDPRQPRTAECCVDRWKLNSILPVEFIRRFQFSHKNDYQFYSLTNVSLRVFDFRYPCIPMNQISHMMDSTCYEALNLKVITSPGSDNETICVSEGGRLCFVSFNQSQDTNVVNPRSEHIPYHEHFINEQVIESQERLYGLDTKLGGPNDDELFSVFQMFDTGDLSVRKYLRPSYRGETGQEQLTYVPLVEGIDSCLSSNTRNKVVRCNDLEPRDILERIEPGTTNDCIQPNLLTTPVLKEVEASLSSKRACERFRKMLSML